MKNPAESLFNGLHARDRRPGPISLSRGAMAPWRNMSCAGALLLKADSPVQRKRLLGMLVLTALLLTGCATSRPVMHGLSYCNIGSTTLSAMYIEYGKLKWPIQQLGEYQGGDTHCLSGGGIGDMMPVPETITVSWKTPDGKNHHAEIPVRSRLNTRYPTHAVIVQFDDDKVRIVQRVLPVGTQALDFLLNP